MVTGDYVECGMTARTAAPSGDPAGQVRERH
jgi:hypothetical protein